jgi:NADH-quinone oxidoreductase subunit N
VQFNVSDVLKILPELMLTLLAVLVVLGDLFAGDATDEQRFRDASSTTIIGLGLIFLVVMLQGGFLIDRIISPDLQPEQVGNAIGSRLLMLLRNLQSANGQTLLNGGLVVDNLLMISRLIFIGSAIITALLMQDNGRPANAAELFGMLVFSVVGMNLMAGAGELISMYLALELASISLYILAGYLKADPRSSEAGIKYYVFGALSSGILLYGFSLLYGYTAMTGAENPTSISTIVQTLSQGTASPILMLSMILIIAGMGYKVAVVPFHSWSPDVYQGAPTPVTAFLSTASKTAGFILLFRILAQGLQPMAGSAAFTTNFGGWSSILALIAFLTMTFANLAAITQSNAKRMLAYSSISHAGFLLIGLVGLYSANAQAPGTFTTYGMLSLVYYLITYCVTNLGAFAAIALIGRALGGDEISDLNGLHRRNLGLAALFLFFVLSLAGIPPLSGFWAKWFVFSAGWESGAIWLVIAAVTNTIISLYYYLRLLKATFLTEPMDERQISIPAGTGFSLIVTAVAVLILGLFPSWFLPAIQATTQLAGTTFSP